MKDSIRATEMFPFTLRTDPSDAATPGHKYLVRAGYIRQLASGLFVLGPLAMRVLWKIEQIVREEMNAIGGLEVNLSTMQPQELWARTGRLERYQRDGIMFSLLDRRNQPFCLAPTAEEVVTFIAGHDLSSYAQLPLNLWQMDWKYRDEFRPRMGLVRGRVFRMKDAYTFDVDETGMRGSYENHRQAYTNMFTRMGFRFISVQADSGAIGGKGSAEFMALSEHGEDVLLTCDSCDYGANLDKAESVFGRPEYDQNLRSMHKDATPNIRTVEQLRQFFDLTAQHMMKTIVYLADERPIAVCCRGDLEINEVKLKNLLGSTQLVIADDHTVVAVTGAPVGFAGPVGLKNVDRIIFDTSVEPMTNFLCGCNEADYHLLDVNLGRDLPRPEQFYDVHNAWEGDLCMACRTGNLKESKGIEIGHIFMLQQGYAEALGVTFLAEDGRSHIPWMGCYGVGTTRCLQALVEQHHDSDGIKWPEAVAPFRFVLVPTNTLPGSGQFQLAERLFDSLTKARQEVVLDDRNMGFGAKMKDALLIGYPRIVVVGRGADDGLLELQVRARGERQTMVAEDFLNRYASG